MTTIAVAQFAPTDNKESNAATITAQVRRASADGARLVVFPEFSMYSVPDMDDRFVESAEQIDGPFVRTIKQLATQYKVTIVLGLNEPGSQGRIHNTLVAVNEDGEIAATYRKIHLYDAFGFKESARVTPGDIVDPETFVLDGLRFGIQTCYDLRFPEVTRRIVDTGVDVVLLPAAWVPGPLKEDHWHTLVRARAIENTIYVAAAGQTRPGGIANSVIVDPMGVTLASAGEEEGVASARVSAERIARVRKTNPALELRRFTVAPR
ncbi:putative amidohydrolase [Rhodococcus sp. 27YEA15]|uniref:carbon-nitrogen hydrolase family protein n=1 Tax=Rhodococcus sp. 27YEA15 TaxID=3156259 RepID=UPI003C7D36AB